MANKQNILIISSLFSENKMLINLIKESGEKDYSFFLLSKDGKFYNQFKSEDWFAKKAYLGPLGGNRLAWFLFILFFPAIFLWRLAYLAYFTLSKKIKTVIFLGYIEKIFITPMAKILGLKIVWLEFPGFNYKSKNKFFFRFFKLNSRLATIGGFTSLTALRFNELGIARNEIQFIPPSIKLKQLSHQDTIFNKLAQGKQGNFHRKYFTVGIVADLNGEQRIKTLFQAVKICLSIINNLQIIVVGDGIKKKDLGWLAKKMEINNLVWFVGQQTNLSKWLDNFDVFIVASQNPNLADFEVCLQAMAAGLPIIGPNGEGMEDIISEDRNRAGLLINMDDNEALSHELIKLQQNKRLRLELSENAKARVDKYFIIDKVVEKFIKLIT